MGRRQRGGDAASRHVVDAGMEPWKVLDSRTVLKRRWLVVHQQHVRLPTGHEIEEFHVLESPDWVAVLALTPEGRVVMVDQYRHGAARTSRELPAGVIDAGESPLEAAKRELLEETGYVADSWEPLVEVNTEPSRHTSRAIFLFASGARRVAEPNPDASENIEVVTLSVAELLEAATGGLMIHGLHLGPILLAERRGLLAMA